MLRPLLVVSNLFGKLFERLSLFVGGGGHYAAFHRCQSQHPPEPSGHAMRLVEPYTAARGQGLLAELQPR
jgi:hypothetical protein